MLQAKEKGAIVKNIFAILLIVLCSTMLYASEKYLGYYQETSTIKLERPALSLYNVPYKNGFILIDSKKGLFYYNNSGKLLTSYEKKGKGPGEFQSLGLITIGTNDSLFVVDSMMNKVIIFQYDQKINKIIYVDDFNVNIGRITSICCYKDQLYMASVGGYNLINIYSMEGELLRSEIPVSKENYDIGGYWMTISGDVLLLAGATNFRLQFFAITKTGLNLVKTCKTNYNHEKGWDKKKSQSKGLFAVYPIKEGFIVTFDPNDSTKYRFIEKFDVKGNYKGTIRLGNKKNKTMYLGFRFSDDGNRVLYQYIKTTLGIPTSISSDRITEAIFIPDK